MNTGFNIPSGVQVYAVGSKTQRALQQLGLHAQIPTQQNGYHLAKLIIGQASVDSVIHFHGNLSRQEMRDELINNGIDVIETEVYQTIIHPVEMPQERVEAILFYSPSAVRGFKQGQRFDQPLPPLFTIGPTTAAALKNETDQPIQIADQPNTDALLQLVSTRIHQKEKI